MKGSKSDSHSPQCAGVEGSDFNVGLYTGGVINILNILSDCLIFAISRQGNTYPMSVMNQPVKGLRRSNCGCF
jgi:hypothetical protein